MARACVCVRAPRVCVCVCVSVARVHTPGYASPSWVVEVAFRRRQSPRGIELMAIFVTGRVCAVRMRWPSDGRGEVVPWSLDDCGLSLSCCAASWRLSARGCYYGFTSRVSCSVWALLACALWSAIDD